ncbi:hypothetical protein PG994_012818 [Apiospora phragmitis]|uniref:Uncharacterized protein n=1 Tax=Apiospora phragmitis TaxID=2905665 RepID=A0ABR1T8L9_9PEZI
MQLYRIGRYGYEGLDAHIAEYFSRPIFWWLALLVVANFGVTIYVGHSGGEDSAASAAAAAAARKRVDERTGDPRAAFQPVYTRWLRPYIAGSPSRTMVAFVLYLVGMGAQLLEGNWVMRTWWRWFLKLIRLWPPWATSSIVLEGVHSLSVLVMLLAGIVLVGFGGVVLLFQLQCLLVLLLTTRWGSGLDTLWDSIE